MKRFGVQSLVEWAARLGSRRVELGLIIVLLGVPIAIAVAHGIDRPFHLEPDAGITWVYQTLLVTDGLRQTSYDHSGFVHFILLGAWFQILNEFGVVSASTLSQVQNAPDLRAAFVELVQAARWFSGLFVGLLAVMFYFGLRGLTGSRVIAFAAALLLAFGTGFVEQATRIHTELFSAFFTYAALFLVIAAARTVGWRGLAWLALAGACAMLAMLSKMQALPLLLGLPVVGLAFGVRAGAPEADPVARASGGVALAAALGLLAFSTIAVVMIAALTVTFDGRTLVLPPQIAQPVFVGYFVVAALLFAAIHRPHWKAAVLGIAVLAAGASAGIYFLFVHHDRKVLEVLVNVLNHMTAYAPGIGEGTPLDRLDQEGWWLLAAGHLADNLRVALGRGFAFGGEGKNLIVTLYWTLGLGCLWAAAKRKWRLAFQVLTLLGMAVGMEVFCRMRSFAPWYYVYVEPWIIVGGALLCAAVLEERARAPRSGGRLDRLMLAGVCVAALAAVPGVVLDAFAPRNDRLESSYCGSSYDFAPRLPGLVCFEANAAPR